MPLPLNNRAVLGFVLCFLRITGLLAVLVDAVFGRVEAVEFVGGEAGREREAGEEVHQIDDFDADVLEVDFVLAPPLPQEVGFKLLGFALQCAEVVAEPQIRQSVRSQFAAIQGRLNGGHCEQVAVGAVYVLLLKNAVVQFALQRENVVEFVGLSHVFCLPFL